MPSKMKKLSDHSLFVLLSIAYCLWPMDSAIAQSAPDIEWQKCLGGTADDGAWSIQATTDSGYIVAGYTASYDGDVNGNHGSYDFWVVKLNGMGALQWQKCLGGTDWDQAQSIQQTTDGGYIVVGYVSSNNGEVSGNHGN